MSIGTYDELKAAVVSWTHRSDLTSSLSNFILLAEARLSRDLQVKELDASSTATTADGTETYSLPSDIAEIRRVTLTDSDGYITELLQVEPELTQYSTQTGKPANYVVEPNLLKLSPIPDAAYTVTYYYRKNITALSDSATTNDILTKFPELYLAAVLVEAFDFVKSQDDYTRWQDRYRQALAYANKANNFGRRAVLASEVPGMVPGYRSQNILTS